jgi:energy-coupling factor transport system permease protein
VTAGVVVRRSPAAASPARPLHPGAWWLWALGLATAVSRTTNPLVLLLVVAVAGYVVASRRVPDAPWARSYGAFLRLGLVVLAVRLVMQVLFGAPLPGRVVLTLPEVSLPEWAAGVRVGGPVTAEALAGALYDGLRLAALLVCVGAANALANPSRLLRCLPAALYEVGVAVVVAMTLAPQMVADVARVRRARRLRGRPDHGVRSVVSVVIPVLEGALERSLRLAAAMDSRGYGRAAQQSPAARRLTGALLLGGLLGLSLGVYGLLDGGSPPLLGLPVLLGGGTAAAAGVALAGRRSIRTRYRPDPWARPEWLVTAAGLAAGAALVLTSVADPQALAPTTSPLEWPPLPPVAVAGVLAGLLPAWAAPVPVPRLRAHPNPRPRPRPRADLAGNGPSGPEDPPTTARSARGERG